MKNIQKIVLLFLISTVTLFAAHIHTPKNTFATDENIIITYEDMQGNDDDWIGVYPQGSSNDWDNVVAWDFTHGNKNGTLTLDAIAVGDYEARAFYANTFNVESTTQFIVRDNNGGANASIETSKSTYNAGETISVTVHNMQGDDEDWIGIYPEGASNDWDNIASWAWTNGIKDGTVTLASIQTAGNYEARAFFANSFDVEATSSFKVTGGEAEQTTISTSKSTYDAGEQISVTIHNMKGDNEDWIGIYPKGASNDWSNIISWAWTNGIKNGTINLTGVPSAGNYEARAFFANSFDTKATSSFNVIGGGNQEPILLEDAENGISNNWETVSGNYTAKRQNGGYQSNYCVKLTTQWKHLNGDRWENLAEYRLNLDNQSSHKKLEIDLGGVGVKMPHYFIGVQVMTTQGERSMIWDSFFNHENVPAFRTDYGNGYIELAYPSPVEHVRGWSFADVNLWNHFSVNIENYLQDLEPGNQVLYIINLKFSGGYLDNITLSN